MRRLSSAKSLARAIAILALCAAAAGCVSGMETAVSGVAPAEGATGTMRYYGGPKYPMWSSNQ